MKKRMLSSFLAICMIFSMLPISAFAADYAMDYDLVVTGSVSNVKAGEETKVELWVKNNVGGLYSLDWQIKYDTEAYEIKAGSLNSWAPDGMTNVSANANIAGQINGGAFIIMSAVETVADTKVCEVTFVAKKDITEPVSFTAGQKSNGTAFADETYYHKVFVDGPTGNTNVAIAVIIEEATVALAAPVKKGTPVTTVEGTNFAGTVTWSPEVGEVFAANTEYTANVTLTANEGYAFEGATPVVADAEISDVTVSADGKTMTFKAKFAATAGHVDADGLWETDGEKHWHTCACGDKIDEGTHEGGEATCVAKAKCEVCGAEYGEVNAENHKGETEVRDALNPSCKDDGYTGDTYCLDCGEMILKGEVIPATGEHVAANDAWETDGENHWHTCACGTEFDKAAHDWAEANCTEPKTCKVCALTEGEALGHSHDMENWKTDKTSHWHQCACGDKIDVAEHVYGDDKYCDICGYKKPAKKPTTVEPEQPIEPEVPAFEDVAEDAYYADAVQWAVENEVTNGMTETTFAPDAICTRAQAVTFLWRAAGAPAPESDEMPFTDVAEGAYYYDAVLWAIEQGITNGTSETTFSPDMTVTRAHVVTFLWRMEGAEEASSENPFVDVEEGTYYYDAVLWAVENEITNGMSEDTFVPANGCTRGQIVTFIYRCMAE